MVAPQSQRVGLYQAKHTILIVGDGNLSFSLSLASFLGGKNIVCTCYDSEQIFRSKYPSSAGNIRALRNLEATVLFRVDATQLHSEQRLTKLQEAGYDRIVFNFPHTGAAGSTPESIQSNQELLQGFFVSASLILQPQGQIHLTLRDTPFYQSWKMPEQAEKADLSFVMKDSFQAELFVGYECARTASSELMRQAPSTEEAFTYCFALAPEHPRYPSTQAQVGEKRKRPKKKKKKTEAKITPEQANNFFCEHCQVKFASQAKWNGHVNSPRHSKAVKAAKKNKIQAGSQPAKKRRA